MADNKSVMMATLKKLIDVIDNANAITTFDVSSVAEFQERPTRHGAEKVPTGWINFRLDVRVYQRSNDARQA